LEEANQVLAEFLPRFNQRFGVPADQPESAYRPVDPELDLGGVLCIKELRRVAKDNTVNTTGGLCNSFPVWSDPATPELGWRCRNVWTVVCWYGIGTRF
jgi:hypothetical protein